MKKTVFYTEIAYILAMLLMAAGTALTAYGNFGISMVVAPAYLLHLKLSQIFPFFTFGVAGYTLQAVILLLLTVALRNIKLNYFLSFAAAFLYSFLLDSAMVLVGFLPETFFLRLLLYVIGAVLCCAAIALLFTAYLPTEAYELCVKEVADKLKKPLHTVKTVYDCCSLTLAFLLSLLFFGTVQGIGIGTVACALLYGTLVRQFQKLYARFFRFADRFPLRVYFEEREEPT